MKKSVLFVFTLLLPVPTLALDLGVDAHAGTMGLGVGAALQLTGNINMRVGLNAYDYGIDIDDEGGLDYDGSLKLGSQYAMIDFYPSRKGKFHFSGGLYLNDNEIKGSATVLNDGTLIGESQALIGTQVGGKIGFDNEAGYVGIGWGNTFSRGMFNLGFDLGVVFQGSPKADLNVVLPPGVADQCMIDPMLFGCISDDDIALEEQQVEDELSDYDVFPLVQVTFGISF